MFSHAAFELAWALDVLGESSVGGVVLLGTGPGARVLALGALDPLGHALVGHHADVALIQHLARFLREVDLRKIKSTVHFFLTFLIVFF